MKTFTETKTYEKFYEILNSTNVTYSLNMRVYVNLNTNILTFFHLMASNFF